MNATGSRVAGVDVGGTFTDLVLVESDGGKRALRFSKLPTTPENQALGVMAAIDAVGVDLASLDLFIHGTTVTTNALLERRIARVGLITTAGFRDVLELGRRTRPKPYGLFGEFEPLIERQDRREVAERMSAQGEPLTPLDEAAVLREAETLHAAGCEALVIHFLHSYANPAHERRAAEIARAVWPNAYVTVGSELLSEFREYERGTTASVNAAVQPALDRYVRALREALERRGFARELLVMNGNGGTVRARHVAREAAKTIMSGPASGVAAAVATLAQTGIKNAIAYDMGGTSTDVALIRDGVAEISSELAIAYGLPVHLPMLDVRTIGAGGGSIARVGAAGLLEVGPASAGAAPGPVSYGRGGTEPTITDAHVALGRLDPARLSAQAGEAARDAACEAIARRVARPLGLSVERAAEAIIALGEIHMSGAVRLVTLARGHDPRDFALFAFGGAGPLHAAALARELGLAEVVVPARPGLTNALGCALAELRRDFAQTLNRSLDALEVGELEALLAEQARAGALGNDADAAAGDQTASHSLDMQFEGQTHILRVPVPARGLSAAEIRRRFDDAYERRFRVRLPELAARVVQVNSAVIASRPAFDLSALAGDRPRAVRLADAIRAHRRVFVAGAWSDAAVLDREIMPRDAELAGPAIIEQSDATIFLPPDFVARLDALGNLRMRRP